MSAALSFCAERKYLENIDSETSPFQIHPIANSAQLKAKWIAIKQVGRPVEKGPENCFVAIQKILYSCFIPKKIQLLFLITGKGEECNMYLGLRGNENLKRHIKHLNEFIKGVWPGIQTVTVDEDDPVISILKEDICADKLDNVYAVTGIPSMETLYKTVYPATIDTLIAGMNKSKNFAYLVVANPIETNDVETMLYECREMDGQAESLKSMNVTEGISEGTSKSMSHTSSTSHTHTRQAHV